MAAVWTKRRLDVQQQWCSDVDDDDQSNYIVVVAAAALELLSDMTFCSEYEDVFLERF